MTYSQAFRVALAFVDSRQIEGGFVDHPADRGGPTNRGITLATFLRANPYGTVEDLKRIDDRTVARIYHDLFWMPARCHRLPLPVAVVHFDAAVNHGPGNAARLLQRALGVKEDGIIGPITLGAASTGGPISIAKRYIGHRRAFYEDIIRRRPSQAVFRKGWMRRMDLLRAKINDLEGKPYSAVYPPGVGPTNAKTDVAEALPKPPVIFHGTDDEPVEGQPKTFAGALLRAAFIIIAAAGAIAAGILGG